MIYRKWFQWYHQNLCLIEENNWLTLEIEEFSWYSSSETARQINICEIFTENIIHWLGTENQTKPN